MDLFVKCHLKLQTDITLHYCMIQHDRRLYMHLLTKYWHEG